MPVANVNYRPAGATVKAFHESEAFVRLLVGPIGSGKSTACILEILRRAAAQRPGADGVRRSRWAVIRNTYPELRTTTLKSWQAWIPEGFGKLNNSPPITHRIQAGDIDAEVLFLALDRPDDERKLLSLELTGAWVNEAREVPIEVINTLTGRVGRYPAMRDGGPSWYGVFLDTNAPDTESDLYRVAEIARPGNWEVFRQPSGLSPEAENIANLPRGYYRNLMAGKSEDWIKVYVHGEYGFVMEGRPVYPMYRDSLHCRPAEAVRELKLLLGLDLGLTPALVIAQRSPDGRWLVLDEIVAEDYGLKRFAEIINSFLAAHYPDFAAVGFYDPAGDARDQVSGDPIIDVIKRNTRIEWHPAPTNDLQIRREAVVGTLNRLIDGEAGFVLSPRCANLRKGFVSGYHFPMIHSGARQRVGDAPVKNKYSHPHDALQYVVLGGGGYDDVYSHERKRQTARGPRVAEGVDYDVFNPGAPSGPTVQRFETAKDLQDFRAGRHRAAGPRIARDVDYNFGS